jgi:hypothetical protein
MPSFITSFKNNFSGGSRANRFLINGTIPNTTNNSPTAFTQFHVRSTILPEMTTTTLSYDYFGRKYHYPGEKQYSTWAFVVLDDTGNNNLWSAFSTWQNRINNHDTNQSFLVTGPQTDYKAYNWEIVHLNLNGNYNRPLKKVILHGCWPVQVGQINLNMAKPNFMNTFQVMVMYDYLEVKGFEGTAISRR